MIVPMLKYSFLVYHAEYSDFLQQLKMLGVLHIQQKQLETTSQMQELYRIHTELLHTIKLLESRRSETGVSGLSFDYSDGKSLLERIRTLEAAVEQKHQQLIVLEKEVKLSEPWGNFSSEMIQALKAEDLNFRFLISPLRKYKPEWELENCLEVINDIEGYRYFVKIERGDEINQTIDFDGVDEVKLPSKSLSLIYQEIELNKKEEKKFQDELTLIAINGMSLLKSYSLDIKSELSELNALHQTTSEAEGSVSMVEGWVPKTKVDELNSYLDAHNILSVSRKPDEDEKVPVLLKNNKFVKLFEFIGDFYDMPNHKELDLTPFFAPFYMMFFGFSLGDAGYGIVLILLAAFIKRKRADLRSVMTLAQFLGLSTVIFGILTGTLFGVNLVKADIPILEGFKEYMLDADKLFYLSLIMGVIQILFGMVVKVFNISVSKGFKYAYSTIGWLVLIIGGGVVFGLNKITVLDDMLAKNIFIVISVISGALILLFNHPRRNIMMNFLVGLWDVYGMTTGLLGDLLSYIRLFALGVSSAILGSVFNTMAMNLKPDIIIVGPVVMILILLIGHSITLFMSTLGAFVHPIRLTFVEFYKNSGFTGGGKRYIPFAAEPDSVE